MRVPAFLSALCAVVLVSSVPAADPPVVGLVVADSEPHSAAPNGAITCPEGRFIPLNMTPGKPSLLLGNDLAYLTLYPLKPGEAVNGIIYNAPANAKTKRYTFPTGANYYAVANELPAGVASATVNLSAVINGTTTNDPPSVAGRLVVSLTAGQPPPVPTTLTLTASPVSGIAPLAVTFSATGMSGKGSLDFGDFSGLQTLDPSAPLATHVYPKSGSFTATLTADGKAATAGVVVTGVVPPQPGTSFRVIWVTESAATLTVQQNAVCGAKAIRDYLNAKATKSKTAAGGDWPDWRNYDPQTSATNEYPAMKALWEAVKPNITTVPCLVIEVNGKADIIPFPANAAEALKTLKKYGGE